MTNDYGGNQLVWPPPDGGGTGGADTLDLSGDGGATFPYREFQGTVFYLNPASGQWGPIGESTTGGSSGRYWLPGEQAQKQQDLDMMQQHYYISDALAAQQEDRLRITDTWQRAVNEGNLALAREQEQRLAANEARHSLSSNSSSLLTLH